MAGWVRLPSSTVSAGKFTPTHMYGAPATLDRRPLVAVPTNMFASNVKERTNSDGNHVLEGLRVFKVGTFTDMFGYEHTWDEIHLDQMAMHYQLLKDGGYFPDVPVRADHSSSVRNVVGYFESVYRDPADPSFLASDIEFTEPDAWDKWQRRTWRSRSIEIGMYETNDGRSFWPVVMGLAFVDIPAVEGLHGRQNSVGFSQAIIDNEEGQVPPDINTDPEGWIKAVNYAAWVQAAEYAQACQDWERAVMYAQALEDEASKQTTPPQPSITPATPPPAPAQHQAPPPVGGHPLLFRVNGQQTADFRAIQSHIDTLESFREETVKLGRTTFVEELAKNNKIMASQIPSMSLHAQSLSDEQFASFRATFEAAPSNAMFSNQGQQDTTPPNPGGAPANGDDPEVLKEIVANHRRTGMSEEKIAKTESYRKLVALGQAPEIK